MKEQFSFPRSFLAVFALASACPAASWAQTGQAAPPAAPDSGASPEAQRLFDEGVAATDRGDFAAGLRAFEAAYALSPLPNTLYNIGMCRMAVQDHAAAANAFLEYVAASGGRLGAEEQAEIDRLLAELTPKIGRLAIDAGASGAAVSIDGAALATALLGSWVAVEPGRHTVAAEKEGFDPASTVVDVAAGETADVRLVLVARLVPPPPATPGAEPLSPWFWASVAIGGAAAVGMAVTGGLALKYGDDYEATGYTDAGLYDTALALRTTTDVLLGVALAGAVAAIVIVLVPGEEETEASSTEVGAGLLPGGLAVWW